MESIKAHLESAAYAALPEVGEGRMDLLTFLDRAEEAYAKVVGYEGED